MWCDMRGFRDQNSKASFFLSGQTQPPSVEVFEGSLWTTEERVCDHYGGLSLCCRAGNDGQLHMAFSPKALLMLEAVV